MRTFLPAAVLLGTLSIAQAADQPPDSQITLSVYNNDLALVQDIRHLDVAAGRSRLEFKDVSAAIKPETVALSAKGLSVIEQNFDYDLLTPAKMMEKAVGKQIQIIRTNPGNGAQTPETATVLSVNEGVVLKVGNHIEVLRDDGIPTRVIFSSIPENLRAQPTLSVSVDAASAGARDVTLSYLTRGLSWKADYVALFNEKQDTMHLQGWVTLTNTSGTSYRNAKTQLIAGAVNLTDGGNGNWQPGYSNYAARSAGTGATNQESIADYYLYKLPERVSVAQNQTKQVGFLDLSDVKTVHGYEYRADSFAGASEPEHAASVLKFSNTGAPLPAGVARVYMRDEAGEPKFVGEDSLDHTPAGSDLAIKMGDAFDITVQPTLVQSERLSKWRTRYQMSYEFKNASSAPAAVDLRQGGMWRDGKVDDESLPSKRIDAHTLDWSVPVPAGGSTTLTFTVETGF
ncbi:MAG TPA: DUF4139 domain-containing protein [Rhizomicrobium sp.]|jgi:hypothetical protein